MSKDRSPWQDGRRAWERLKGWHQDGSSGPGHPDDGAAAVQALTDVGTVRHLLDRAEMIAVRTARRHGRSWSEIAVQLGITRQSAWERWRDLDPEPDPSPKAATVAPEVTLDDAATSLVTLVERNAAQDRRRSTIVVPNVIGMIWDAAREALRERRLVGVSPDQDGSPLATAGWPDGVVIDQSPESGAKVPPGSPVILWIERGGGSAGVREPRRPAPAPKSARQMRSEPTDETAS